jgi:hypothetical protein
VNTGWVVLKPPVGLVIGALSMVDSGTIGLSWRRFSGMPGVARACACTLWAVLALKINTAIVRRRWDELSGNMFFLLVSASIMCFFVRIDRR